MAADSWIAQVEKSTSQAASSHRAERLQWLPIIVRKIAIPRKIGTNPTNALLREGDLSHALIA
jgi:hypothetical protein